jgi:hypothetical protein
VLYALTPTHDRPEAFALLRKWIDAQNYDEPFMWIVVHDGPSDYDYGPRPVVIRRRGEPGPGSLAANVAAGVRSILENSPSSGDTILFLEDDDYYSPEYLWTMRSVTGGLAPLAGLKPTFYYNIRNGRYDVSRQQGHASLATTAMRGDVAATLLEVAARRPKLLDRDLWRAWLDGGGKAWLGTQEYMHLSIKGLPGTAGFTRQHRDGWGRHDHDGSVWRRWGIPDDYLALASPLVREAVQDNS